MWYVGVVLFIMYRLKPDDLEQLEAEAERRMQYMDLKKHKNKSQNL